MSNEQDFDAIIIGAGVIGNAVAFELSKQGLKTLNIDRNHVSGYGSTSASCAIIRVHYSTFDGCALAYESYHFWKDWMAYLEASEHDNLAKFIECGCMIYQTEQNNYLDKVIKRAEELNIPHELWDPRKIKEKLRIVDTNKYGPVKSTSDKSFGSKTGYNLR